MSSSSSLLSPVCFWAMDASASANMRATRVRADSRSVLLKSDKPSAEKAATSLAFLGLLVEDLELIDRTGKGGRLCEDGAGGCRSLSLVSPLFLLLPRLYVLRGGRLVEVVAVAAAVEEEEEEEEEFAVVVGVGCDDVAVVECKSFNKSVTKATLPEQI